ncbi:TIGR03086 family metal-binding protein [Actinoplanes sp. NPDC049548]|uniref:TIGR03086 family metal-binding protein n=1 Tax=Actinoplanes sp. NPDC049548 TaxID=3155152 RepID=UPI00342B43C1
MRTVELDERAVRATVTVVAQISPDDLSSPTPCASWDLAALLAHMVAQHRGFAAAAEGRGADREIWVPKPLGPEPLSEYAEAAETVISAFAAPGRLDAPFHLPEIGARPIPGRLAIAFHFVDYVVHGWDVARTIGVPYELDDDLLAAALPIAEGVPDDAGRLAPGAAFAPSVPDPGTGPLDRILALLGRHPGENVVPPR